MTLLEVLFIAAAYLVGSIPTGVVVARLFSDKDIQNSGSGNIGATNVGRVLGKKYGIITFLGDALKGFIPVYAASLVATSPLFLSLTGLSAIVGHLFPVYLRFRGGKGVATAFGVFIFLAPYPALMALLLFATVVILVRYVSVGSITAVAMLPVSSYVLSQPPEIVAAASAVSVLVIVKHSANIKRLISGTENRIGGNHRNVP